MGESVEVDAISPAELRRMVSDSILQHIDERQLQASRLIEEQERQTLQRIARNLPTAFRQPGAQEHKTLPAIGGDHRDHDG